MRLSFFRVQWQKTVREMKYTLKTPWTGDIVDQSYFTDKKYEKYRQPGNIKIPFWLKPVKYYKGVAWYQKEFEIPAEWEGKECNSLS